MIRRTPMKRTGWGNLPPTNKHRAESGPDLHIVTVNAAKFAIKPVVKSMAVMVKIGDLPHAAIDKENAVRSEPYRKLVAAYPCKHCGIVGFSQAAHVPPNGKGIKMDDRLTFPLCCDRPDKVGCHPQFDQFKLFPKFAAVAIGLLWASDTRRQIIAAGKWPKRLPLWTEP